MSKYPVLQRLTAEAVATLPEAFFRGVPFEVSENYIFPCARSVDLADLYEVVDCGLEKFEQQRKMTVGESWKSASDGWLAPRVHAALRLTREEAADPQIWNFLAICAFPEYVVWRWGREAGRAPLTRFTGPDNKHALKRLWWGAELVRSGGDYSLVEVAFSNQDIPNTLLSLRAVHNPAVAVAVMRYIQQNALNSKQINRLSTKLNTTAVTVSLDLLAPLPVVRDYLMEEGWLGVKPDDLLEDRLPVGPAEEPIREDHLSAITQLLEELNVKEERSKELTAIA